MVGGAGDDTLLMTGLNLSDATVSTDTGSGVTTFTFGDGTVVTVESVETVIFDDDVLKL